MLRILIAMPHLTIFYMGVFMCRTGFRLLKALNQVDVNGTYTLPKDLDQLVYWIIDEMIMITSGALGGVKGHRNASILGVNKITGGTIQERTQAWADYHFGKGRFKASVFDEINIKNLNEISSKFKF
jgi:hypothetical protein